LIDKNVNQLLTLCNHHVILQKGHSIWPVHSVALRECGETNHRRSINGFGGFGGFGGLA
jgi:hypothetical protein